MRTRYWIVLFSSIPSHCLCQNRTESVLGKAILRELIANMPDISQGTPLTQADLTTLNYIPLYVFNNTDDANGGDSLNYDLNVFYTTGDIAWVVTASALVLLMIPGVGFFYSGLARRKSALSLIWLSLMSVAVVSFQWFFWGYSLAFSHGAGKYIGNLDNIGFRNVLAHPSVGSPKIPDLLFAIYQCMFAAIT